MKVSRVPCFPLPCLPVLLCLAWTITLCPARAAQPGANLIGLRLLQAELPAGGSLRRLNCDALARTERAAIRAHRAQAVQVFMAALSLDEWDTQRDREYRLSCGCVVRLFHTAAAAAPERAMALLEAAEALYPDCADPLTAALSNMDGKATVAVAKTSGDDSGASIIHPGDGVDGSGGNNGNPGNGHSDGGNDTGGGLPGGSGSGIGPGFPGSPGFGGSAPSGSIVLPTPVPVQVTIVVNN